MTENELARALFGRREREARESGGTTITVTATATADSADGMVPVDFGTDIIGDDKVTDPDTGEVVYAPPSQSVEVPVAGGVSAGDTVSVLIVDGTPVQAIGTGSVDRVGAVAESASTAAQEAKAVAEATGQHFWHDTRGAHVTEAEKDDYLDEPSGFQNLMTSIGNIFTRAVSGVEKILRSDTASGMVVYDGECAPDAADLADHAVAAFTAEGAQIGKNSDAHIEMDFNSFHIVDRDGATFFNVDDMRDENGYATLNETFYSKSTFTVAATVSEVIFVRVNNTTAEYTRSGNTFTLTNPPTTPPYNVTVRYTTSDQAQYYTLGERKNSSIIGIRSVAEGARNTASGTYCHAEGYNNYATGYASHAEGKSLAIASGIGSHAEGSFSDATGDYSHAEGFCTEASGYASHAEGGNSASGNANTTASGDFSHAEGYVSLASGFASHAEGGTNNITTPTTASGDYSHAEGYKTEASGMASHTEGNNTIAASANQHVEGKYNIADTSNTYAHIVGNGTSNDHRRNAHTVDWSGNAWYAGDVSADGGIECADGSPYCKDGTDVKVGGTTVGSADNLSYVASGALFRVELCVSPSHTIPANSGATYGYTPTAISGYKPIGVVGFQNDAGWSAIVMGALVSIDEGKVYTVTRNNTSSAVTLKDYIRVLYIRDGFTV